MLIKLISSTKAFKKWLSLISKIKIELKTGFKFARIFLTGVKAHASSG